MKTAKAYFGEKVVQRGLNFLSRQPEKNLERLMTWAERLALTGNHKAQIRLARNAVCNTDSNWHRLAVRILKETHPTTRNRLVTNFFLNSWLVGIPRQQEISKKSDFNVPYTILIDPTARCNLRCLGCWAGDYHQKDQLELETLDRILSEAQDLGIYFIVLSGGEPLLIRDDLIYLARKHREMAFHVYTNGTLVDEKLVQELVALGNVTLAFSLEGFEEHTDARRGSGVFQKVMRAMDLMREAGLIFGFSATYTRKNAEVIADDAFIDLMVDKGCLYGWLFTYVPVGKDVDLQLMVRPEQRARMYLKVTEWRRSKPIMVADFWNDGELTQGCIAGGRRYFHINAAGEVEPCAFVHYSTCNIKNISLTDALRSPLMRAYQKRQPFNGNMLRPCPLIDNPQAMAEIVDEAAAYHTQVHGTDTAEVASALAGYSERWGRVADALWTVKSGK